MEASAGIAKLLGEIGMLAAGHGYEKQAVAIFEGLKAVRPASEAPAIGLAVVHLSNGRAEDAVRVLRDEALAVNPGSDLARSFLGLALKAAGRAQESEQLLRDVVAKATDPQAKAMAAAVLKG